MTRYLTINRCPNHSDSWAISIDSADAGGARLTTHKCCGRWIVVKQFNVSAKQLRDICKELEFEAYQMETEE